MQPALDPSAAQVMLAASGVAKRFGSTRALVNADIEIRAGEIHGLMGANGAGKSTLSRVITGHIARDAGDLSYKGAPFAVTSARDALRSGIALVAQETSLAPDMTVLENIFLPELGRPGRLSFPALRQRARAILERLGRDHVLPLDAEVRRLSAAQRQLVEIAKALALDASLVIFDEPTSSLSPSEVDRLFDIMSRLRDDGRGLVFVSHRLEEVLTVTDRVTVVREGSTVARNLETATLGQSDLIRHMVGQDIGAIYASREARAAAPGEAPLLEVANLSSLPAVRDVSFAVHRGEVLGLGGLVGAGRSEAVEALFGLRRRDGGIIRVGGRVVDPRTPAQAIRLGIGLVAEDRRAQNIVPDLTVRENLFLAHMGRHRGFGLGYGRRRARLAELLARLDLPASRLDANLLTFSGGMQQKVIIARWLLVEPEILILDEPTKGVDIGTRSSIYAILRDIADAGVAVVVISSDFEELLGICQRVVAISDGISIADLPASVLTEEKLTLLAAPRTSTERNMRLLRDLAESHGAAAFWALLDRDELICLASTPAPYGFGVGLVPGQVARHAETGIPQALARRAPGFTTEPGSGISTLLVPVRNRRGHDLGWIGLSLPPGRPLPPADDIARRIGRLADPDAPAGTH